MMVPDNRAAESASGHMYPMELRMVTKGRTRSMTGKALDRQHISGTQCRPLQKMEGLKLHEGILTQKNYDKKSAEIWRHYQGAHYVQEGFWQGWHSKRTFG